MGISDKFNNLDDFIEELRGLSHFYCFSIEGFHGFVVGYCLGKKFDASPLWDKLFKAIEISDLPLQGRPWMDRIQQASPTKECEIPVFFALLDSLDEEIKESWSVFPVDIGNSKLFQDRFRWSKGLDEDQIPPPHQLLYLDGGKGFWRLFYLDEKGKRYNEFNFRSQQKLTDWAETNLGVPVVNWVRNG